MQPSTLSAIKRDDGPGSWGTGIAARTPTLRLFKLALLHTDDLVLENELPDSIAFVNQSISEIRHASWTGTEAVTTYLKRLWADADRRIKDELQEKNVAVAEEDMCFLFTNPAVWSDETVSRMKKAIEASNVVRADARCGFMDEPKAAALAVIPQLQSHRPLQKGQTVVIADLGGGTADFISYYIDTVTPLCVGECVAGEGRLLGDMFMRRALYSLVTREVERTVRSEVKGSDLGKVEAQAEELWLWSRSRPATTLCTETRTLNFQLHDGTNLPVVVQGGDIVNEFRTITDRVIELAKSQMRAVREETDRWPDVLVVVGGFGRNKFLEAEMRRDPLLAPRVEITGEQGQLAVKNGAAIACVARFGGDDAGTGSAVSPLAPEAPMKIVSLIPSQSYGYWDGVRPKGQISWFIRKGRKMSAAPLVIPLIPEAFREREEAGCPSIPIYRVCKPTEQSSAIPNTNGVVTQQCQILCKRRELLDLNPPPRVELRVEKVGRVMDFQVLIEGYPDGDRYFRVQGW
ncbi:uncharacterized protein B0H64DRAFT_475826 [Chaetomium fimeti]|uniref:Uncharacterized protein n=1 Tax=Chaetomium fimeti TaxID=1854472 RepID=A0AAE0LRM2_9PEZI|nr:hypothetical protein B0H64DRAFT_475826 [Chaetomium fimeti]